MIINYYKQSLKVVLESIGRFLGSFIFSILLFMISSYMIVFNDYNNEAIRILYCLIIGISFFTFIKILFERIDFKFKFKFKEVLLWAVPISVSILFYFVLKIFNNNIYSLMCIFGIIIFQVIFSLYLCSYKDISITFSYICINLFFNFLFCTILLIGSWICIFAFLSLIYNFEGSYNVYIVDLLFILTVVFINLFLSNIPSKGTKICINDVFKTVVAKIMFPAYLILTLILYFYLTKILITMDFPSNRVNIFGIIASIFYMFFVLSLSQYKGMNTFIDFFIKFSGYFILPIVLMNFTAMYIRIQEYGLTASRYLCLIFNFAVIIFAVLHEVRKVKFIPVVFSFIPIIFTFTPINIIDIPILEQSLRLKNILIQNNMIQSDGTISINKNLSFDAMHRITSSYFYIKNSDYSKVVLLDKDIFEKDFDVVFGFEAKFKEFDNKYERNLTFNYGFIDIDDYKKVRYVSNGKADSTSNTIVLNVDGDEFKYDISKYIEKFLDYDNNLQNIEIETDRSKFIVTFLNYSIINDKTVNIGSYAGYLLVK